MPFWQCMTCVARLVVWYGDAHQNAPTRGWTLPMASNLSRKLILSDGGLLLLKMAGMFPYSRPEGHDHRRELMYEIVARYRVLHELHSDQGVNLGSQVVA